MHPDVIIVPIIHEVHQLEAAAAPIANNDHRVSSVGKRNPDADVLKLPCEIELKLNARDSLASACRYCILTWQGFVQSLG